MNNAVHIQVKMIELRQERRVRHNLVNLGIALREPSVELFMQGIMDLSTVAII